MRLTAHLPADAPQLTELPQDVTVELGRSALLACRATGRPSPMVTWRRGDGQPLGPGRGSTAGRPDSGLLFFESKRLGLRESGLGRQNGFRHPQPPDWVAGSRALTPSADHRSGCCRVIFQLGDSGHVIPLLCTDNDNTYHLGLLTGHLKELLRE